MLSVEHRLMLQVGLHGRVKMESEGLGWMRMESEGLGWMRMSERVG